MIDRVSEYRLVEANSPVELVKNVKTSLLNGWHLSGSAFYSEKREQFYQPMVKYETTIYRGPW